MKKFTFTFATIILVSQFSLAIAAEPGTRQHQRHPMQQQSVTVPPLQITSEYLNQQILALTQQVQALQSQINILRSVVQVTPNGATIQAEYLTINGGKSLTLTSSKNVGVTAGELLAINSGKDIELKSQKDLSIEAASQIKLKGTQIKLNNGTKGIALQDSPVAGGKVISGSTSVFAQ